MNEKLLVPDIGDFEKVEIIEILVKEGDKVAKNDPVITLESDKSSVEVPSTFEGVVDNINIKIGDKVSKGDLILTFSSINGAGEKEKINEKIPPITEQIIEEAENSIDQENLELDRNKNEEIIDENLISNDFYDNSSWVLFCLLVMWMLASEICFYSSNGFPVESIISFNPI